MMAVVLPLVAVPSPPPPPAAAAVVTETVKQFNFRNKVALRLNIVAL